MSGSSAIVLSNRSYPTPAVASNFAKNPFDWQTLSTQSSMPTGGSISRSGNAMMYDATGKLTYAPNNLLTYSNTFNNAAWTGGSFSTPTSGFTDPLGGTNAWRLQSTATTWGFAQNFAIIAPAVMVTCWVKSNTGSSQQFRLYTGGVNYSSNLTATTTWQQFTFVGPQAVSGYSNGLAYATGAASNADLLIYAMTVSLVTYETSARTADQVITTSAAYYGPRFDYDPATLAAKGLLIEGARTNLFTYSEQVNSWSLLNATASADVTTSPSGVANADKVVESATTAIHYAYLYPVTGTSSTTYTFSVYAKAAGRSWVNLLCGDGFPVSSNAYFNLATGVVGTVGANVISASIQSVGNGWYRCSVTATTSGTALGLYVTPATADNTNSYAGDGVSGIYLWGAQIEVGRFASSYVPNLSTGSTARAAETFAITSYSSNLIEAYYTDEATGLASSLNYAAGVAPSTSYGWTTSLRVYTNAYAGDIATPSWIDNSGTTGNRMVTDSTGALTWAPNNYLLNSATLSTQSVTTTGTTGGELGANYILSFSGTGSVALSGTGSGTLAGTGVSNRVSLAFTATYGTLTLTVTGTVTNAQLELVTYQTSPRPYLATTSAAVYQPRYDYDGSTVPATPRGMLIEESRINLCTNSDNLGTSYTPSGLLAFGSGSTLNAATSPDGTVSADLITEDTTTGLHRIFKTITSVANTAYSFSFYAKRAAGTRNIYAVVGVGADLIFAKFNLEAGTVITSGIGGTGTLSSASIEAAGNGYYRIKLSGVISTTGTAVITQIQLSNSTNTTADVSYAGDGASGVYLWGLQYEAGSFVTSLIPTTSASVTRVADVVKLTGSALTVAGAATGSAIVQTTKLLAIGTRPILGDYNTRRLIYTPSVDTSSRSFNGTTALSATIGGSGQWTTGPVRTSIGWDTSGRSIVANNGTVATDASVMGTIATVYLGYDPNVSTNNANGWFASLALYNTKLPDAVLKQKSATGAPY